METTVQNQLKWFQQTKKKVKTKTITVYTYTCPVCGYSAHDIVKEDHWHFCPRCGERLSEVF